MRREREREIGWMDVWLDWSVYDGVSLKCTNQLL